MIYLRKDVNPRNPRKRGLDKGGKHSQTYRIMAKRSMAMPARHEVARFVTQGIILRLV